MTRKPDEPVTLDANASRRCFLKTAGAWTIGLGATAPAMSALAEALTTKPYAEAKTGKRWAMVIDTRACNEKANCDACSRACHVSHNVPHFDDPHHEIKWIWPETWKHTFEAETHENIPATVAARRVVVLCNHCENPPCVRVCPTQATWKREDGIVMMDMHRCIGCRFCVVGCPYGSRSFNWKDPRPNIANLEWSYPTRSKGVVEKCTFCEERLAKGLMPACVEACDREGNKAMIFGDLGDPNSKVAEILRQSYTIRRKASLGTAPHVFYLV